MSKRLEATFCSSYAEMLTKNKVEHIAQESLSELWDVGYASPFFGKVIALSHR